MSTDTMDDLRHAAGRFGRIEIEDDGYDTVDLITNYRYLARDLEREDAEALVRLHNAAVAVIRDAERERDEARAALDTITATCAEVGISTPAEASGYPMGIVRAVEEMARGYGRVADSLVRMMAGVDRFISAYGPHLNERWRAHLEELTGERRFFGMCDAGRPASTADPEKAASVTDTDKTAAEAWRKEQSR